MKILILTHGFPPHRTAGTETYSAELALALTARGHSVRIFTAHKDISRPDYQLTRREWRGVVVHELQNNLFHDEFDETYDNPRVDAAFESVVAEFAPDVVHVQHLLYLSGGCIPIARASGAVIVFTLHDFWLECARFGQRVHADGGLCERIDFARCGTCLAQFKYGNSGLERKVGGVLAGLRTGTGIDLAPLVRGAAARIGQMGASPASGDVDADRARRFAASAEARTRHLQRVVLPCVDLFVSPSKFLRERFVAEWRIPADRIEHVRFGVDASAFNGRARVAGTRAPGESAKSAPLRVRFLGSLVPLKGPHLLLAAWARLEPALRESGDLVLFGSARHHPEYQAMLAASAAACGARLGGHLDRGGVARVLAETDLLVVPSTWYENSPLVILEALASRTPVLVSNLGGMKELVEPGVSGFHFEVGDVTDLARQLTRALKGELGLAQLYTQPIGLPSFAEHVDAIEARYQRFRQLGGGST